MYALLCMQWGTGPVTANANSHSHKEASMQVRFESLKRSYSGVRPKSGAAGKPALQYLPQLDLPDLSLLMDLLNGRWRR